MGFDALVLLLLLLLSDRLGILAAGDADPTQAEVEKAKPAHGDAVEKAKQALLDGFDAEIKSATKKGDLALLDELTSELASFTSEGNPCIREWVNREPEFAHE